MACLMMDRASCMGCVCPSCVQVDAAEAVAKAACGNVGDLKQLVPGDAFTDSVYGAPFEGSANVSRLAFSNLFFGRRCRRAGIRAA